MPRRTFRSYGFESRRVRLMLSPDNWADLDSLARKKGIFLPTQIEYVVAEWCSARRHETRERLRAEGDALFGSSEDLPA